MSRAKPNVIGLQDQTKIVDVDAENDTSLFEQVIALTGLPQESLRKEMMRALEGLEQTPDSLDLEHLRALVANYVQEVLVELKNDLDA